MSIPMTMHPIATPTIRPSGLLAGAATGGSDELGLSSLFERGATDAGEGEASLAALIWEKDELGGSQGFLVKALRHDPSREAQVLLVELTADAASEVRFAAVRGSGQAADVRRLGEMINDPDSAVAARAGHHHRDALVVAEVALACGMRGGDRRLRMELADRNEHDVRWITTDGVRRGNRRHPGCGSGACGVADRVRQGIRVCLA